jgi:hypothetical protein
LVKSGRSKHNGRIDDEEKEGMGRGMR